jgi:hypothetical protein
MASTGLSITPLKPILSGGKGSIGKTTCAAIAGPHPSDAFRTSIISTYPHQEDAESVFTFTILGMDEVMAPITITDPIEEGRFSKEGL